MTEENENKPQQNEDISSKSEEAKPKEHENQKQAPTNQEDAPTAESDEINQSSDRPPKADSSETTSKSEKPKRPRKKRTKKDQPPEKQEPSPNQPLLDHYVKMIKNSLGDDSIEEAFVNRSSKELPTITATPKSYFSIAKLLRDHEELQFQFLSDLHGIDYESHMEIYVYLYSMTKKQSVALKVKLDRDNPVIPSLVPLWKGANWPENEAYDLLGITFEDHPDLKRIMLGEDWEGYPLRKDYEPYDVEV
ncbi:hypothetical protein GCM10008986_10960 [Salinibacillus aidingensis]|uniref:NAD(P)H dehydrogenase subunit J n=1 Tax=Salinibacillus aidingensis TaxID=237684 RepID=A0ABN1AZP2_9BACI